MNIYLINLFKTNILKLSYITVWLCSGPDFPLVYLLEIRNKILGSLKLQHMIYHYIVIASYSKCYGELN